METNTDFAQLFVGIHIMQIEVTSVEFAHNIGRKGVITDAILDEKGNTHLQTDDGVWCPLSLVVYDE